MRTLPREISNSRSARRIKARRDRPMDIFEHNEQWLETHWRREALNQQARYSFLVRLRAQRRSAALFS